MSYIRIPGFPRKFSLQVRKQDFISRSGNVFSGDIKIKGKLVIEGNTKAMAIDEGSFRTKGLE